MPLKTPLPEKIEPIECGAWTKNSLPYKLNQLIDVVAELTEVVQKQEAQITNLRGGWTDVEIKNAAIKPWPQMYDTIYRLNSRGEIIDQPWTGSDKQKKCRAFLGIFKTREEAEVARTAVIDHINSLGV